MVDVDEPREDDVTGQTMARLAATPTGVSGPDLRDPRPLDPYVPRVEDLSRAVHGDDDGVVEKVPFPGHETPIRC